MTEKNGPEGTQRRTEYVALPDAQPVESPNAAVTLPFHTVVVGASAGGVEAVMRLFGSIPADSGCAFVVVLHLPAERESVLPSLIARTTSMPVEHARHDAELEADHVYVAPPGQFVEFARGRLQLRPVDGRPLRPVDVDHSMMSLAADQRERSIGIVLTGLDSDGALGIKAIKAEGGLTLAQRSTEAAHPGMPLSALATGQVDCELAIEDMAQAIVGYVGIDGAVDIDRAVVGDVEEEQALREILDVVRAQLGLDFRGYKSAMLLRRVARRMGLTRTSTLKEFARRLQEDVIETRALAEDFLISVTEFFREPEAWRALTEDALPGLLQDKRIGDSLRVWVPACATGEEAYSMAMTLLDHPVVKERGLKLQIFATDIDENALEFARRGTYPHAIENTVAAASLQRFFVKSASKYQVRKTLRDVVMFATQNLVNDPPFSRMDIVSCRNLLIYMGTELQSRLLQVFHFALEPGGILVLGKSETIGSHAALFIAATQRAHLYRRVGAARPLPIVSAPQASWRSPDAGEPPRRAKTATDYGNLMRDALLDQRVAAAVVTDESGQARYFYGPVHAYLQQPEGTPTTDLFAMVRDELRPQLRVALHKAHSLRDRVETIASMHVAEQGEHMVRLVVSPLESDPRADLMMVTFERIEREVPADAAVTPSDAIALRAVEDELRTTKRELRAAIEELESANEELKVANEEAMSMNEELQSANEELETSKEELQSVNEELTTVNHQLEEKVGELEIVNNDLGNLLTSTHIPTLFLDRSLRIKRFTPAATLLFPLLPSDLNRPLSDIAGPNDLVSLLDDARRVLTSLAPRERETRSIDGAHFLRRTLPYRTQEDRIEGVVITFADISELKRAGEGLRRHAAVMQTSNDAIIVQDLNGRITAWNRGAETLYGYSEDEMIGADISTVLPTSERRNHARLIEQLKSGERLLGVDGQRRRRDGTLLDVSISSSLVLDDAGRANAVALTERDVSAQKLAETELRESERRFRTLADSAPALIWMTDENGALEFVNQEFMRVTGLGADQLIGRWWVDLLHHEDIAPVSDVIAQLQQVGASTNRIVTTARLGNRAGQYRAMKIALMPRGPRTPGQDDAAAPANLGTVGTMVDIDAQVSAERALTAANRHKDEFLAMLGHELRNPLVPIRNAAEILSHVAGEDGRLHWVRDTLVRQVEHVTRLVDDLLDISMVTRNALRLHLEPVDLEAIVDRAIEAVTPLMQRKRHRFERTRATASLWVEGDAIRLVQVLENLLTNAAKYTDEQGSIALAVRIEDGRAVVEVSDDGLGIEPQQAARIFELFVQDQRSIDRSQGGLGIGLALVRRLVELHGGTAQAFSAGVNQGSRFVITLPLLDRPVAQAPAPVATEHTTHGRVMIVDDDEAGAESMAMLLEIYGYEVRTANSVEAALETARTFRPQVVLLDIAMPTADGYEIARRLRALQEMPADTAYMALSGFGRPEDHARSKQAEFVHHLVKPVDPRALERLLQDVLKEGPR